MLRWRMTLGSVILFLLLLLGALCDMAILGDFSASFVRIIEKHDAHHVDGRGPVLWSEEEIRRLRDLERLHLGAALLLLGAGASAALLTWHRFGRAVLDPIGDITRSIQEMEAEGFTRLLPRQESEEMNRLADAVNNLAVRVRESRQATDLRIRDLDLRHRAVLESLPSPFFLINSSGGLESTNPAGRRLLERTGLAEGLPPAVQRLVDSSRHYDMDYLPDQLDRAVYLRMDGHEEYYLPRIFRLKEEGGAHAFGLAVMLIDVTRFRWLDDLKTGQIATVSHEIKTPLTAIRLMLHLLLEKKFGDLNAKQDEMLRLASADSERLLRTLNHLLELSRLEAGAEQLRLLPEKSEGLACLAVRSLSENAAERGIRLEVDAHPGTGPVWADHVRIGHVFGNLVTNAVKYSPAGSVVRVAAVPLEDGFVRFSVTDQGPGIPEEFHTRIFDRFFRVPGTQEEGVGLGLSIAREIVRAHAGRIGLDSTPGGGSTFYFDLPCADEPPDVSRG